MTGVAGFTTQRWAMLSFAELTLRNYPCWSLHLNHDQRYLGRAYAWLNRGGTMQRFSQLIGKEGEWLQIIIKKYESAMRELWAPDHMNYAWLGNDFEAHQGH